MVYIKKYIQVSGQVCSGYDDDYNDDDCWFGLVWFDFGGNGIDGMIMMIVVVGGGGGGGAIT